MSTKQDDTLKGLLETAKAKRLSPEEEEQALQALKALIAAGKKGLEASLEALTGLPWSLGVKAVVETWPELKPTTQRQFITALGKLESDQGKRMRLSVARGLFALDRKIALKLILGFCSEMDEAGPKERQLFNNVLIGKTKPWILNVPLGELKNAEANSLVKCILPSAQQSPAFTQVWVYGWISEAGFFAKLNEEQIASIASAVKRWQSRWQKELKKAVPTLPAPIEEALTGAQQVQQAPKPEPKAEAKAQPEPQPQGQPGEKKKTVHPPLPKYPGRVFPKKGAQPAQETGEAVEVAKPEEQGEEPKAEEQVEAPEKVAAEGETEAQQAPKESRERRESREGKEGRQQKGQPKAPVAQQQHPQHQPPPQRPQQEQNRGQRQGGQGAQGVGGFDLHRALGEIQSYVGNLKAEVQQLKGQLRQRENNRRNEPREREQPSSEELETLRRHNIQLEETIQQLRHDIEELVSDHEDRASTLGMSDDLLRFKTLLGVKLGKDFFDFEALRRESATEVVRRHLGHILDHVFGVLKAEGVDFKDEE